MANNNGWKTWLIRALILIIISGFTTAHTMTIQYVLGNDKESRDRDAKIQNKLSEAVIAQQETNGKTNVVLERILVKLENIETQQKELKEEVKNNGRHR